MNAITDTLRELVRRRLWPLAVLLVAALVAVPVVLAKNPEPAAPAPANAAAAKSSPATTSYVQLVSDDGKEQTKRRRVLGEEKDPFEPAPLPKPKKKKTAKKTAAKAADATPTPTPTPSTGSSGGSDGTVTTPVAPVATPAPKTYPKGSLKIRFGKVDGDKKTTTLERLKALPSSSSPVLVYTGLEDHGKTAVFMLSGDVTAEGDGTCDPAGDSCETLKLRVGDTEFLTVTGTGSTDGQYELDLELIH
jgi:hypothetical protein